MATVREKIDSGYYESKVPYPHGVDRKSDEYRDGKRLHSEDQSKLYLEFENDLAEENGMKGHPKERILYSKAWEEGHSNGLSGVEIYYCNLLELVK